MRLEIDVTLDYQLAEPADILLQVEVAPMADQVLIDDKLQVTSAEKMRPVPGYEAIGQRTWARAEGGFHLTYSATVEIDRPAIDLCALSAVDPRRLPGLVVPYLMPSRYVESDQFEAFAAREFGHLAGGAKVQAMLDWIRREFDYVSGVSDGSTTAANTFVQRQGVCRDYAHLLAGLARASFIPARLVSAYAPDVTPQDFHAVVEVWLSDGWHLVDATGMASCGDIARIGVGRDATDVAFMTIFGGAQMIGQQVRVSQA